MPESGRARRDGHQVTRRSALPDLQTLHLRHKGLTEDQCGTFAEAASVCLARHHTSPTVFQVETGTRASARELRWPVPSDRILRSQNNRIDATENGAYSVCLSTLEAELGLVAIQRADIRTGADWYVAKDNEDLEQALRFEVSGLDEGDRHEVLGRLGDKVKQARRGQSDLPAIAGVVGFLAKLIAIRHVV